ncbi:SDR family NAD(P)-dependent oxidoreductase [Aeromicrobium sp.]|uniref:SDR family NAD(P)-dependent oxidoreductase n=1 Tax=Aeromicrobium sp. TaxID=1871063 RepID=UPI003D6A1355
MSLAGQTVVLTGASSGIGAHAARQMAKRGATVCLLARRADELEQVRDRITSAGGTAHVYAVDLVDAEAADATIKQLLADHPRIDVLVNNAARSIRRPITESLDRVHDYERTININYLAAVRLTLGLLPRFLEQGHGHVVVSTSMSTQIPIPLFSAYLASKSALESFARSLSAELGDRGITTTIVHFPMVRTEMSTATEIYQAMPMMSARKAARWLVKAAESRPARVTSITGRFGELGMATAPGVITAVTRPLFRRMDASLARRTRRR